MRKFYQRVLVLLQKPARKVTFESSGDLMFLDMLAEPYQIELADMIRIQDAKAVETKVSLNAAHKVELEFSESVHAVSLDAAGVAKLTQQVNAAQGMRV